ncbi:MAG: methionyl-tRNA formyltransferase [Myxococcota bacterium]
MRVVFYGTPEFAVPTLDALCAAGHDVVLVVAQPDKVGGRGNQLIRPPVAERALALGLPLAQPKAVKSGPFPDRVVALAPDVAVVVAYGRILPPRLLAAPRYGCVNVHASLLPRWRGAAPIHRAVLAGDAVTGVCTQRMEEGLDTGPVYLERRTPIGPRETSGELHDRLMALAAAVAVDTLALLPGDPVPQDEAQATWAPKLDKAEAEVTFALAAGELDRRVRGYDPWPGAYVAVAGGALKLKQVSPLDLPGEAGVVSSIDPLVVGCGVGSIALQTVQAPGKKPVSGRDFANGARLRPGDRLGG